MTPLRILIYVTWLVFWIYWLVSAAGAKSGSRPARTRPPGLVIVVLGFLLIRVSGVRSPEVTSVALQAVGLVVFLSGLALAIWARVYLGSNWGMPMTRKDQPELVTSGPYRFVRHPIYSGILLGLLGTALATNIYWLMAGAVMGAYFIYSARVEEALLTKSFPTAYPSYRARTKMLIPFVL